jgi:hypothetical protein
VTNLTCPRCSRKLLETQVWEVVSLDENRFWQAMGDCPFHGRVNLARTETQGWTEIKVRTDLRPFRRGTPPPKD